MIKLENILIAFYGFTTVIVFLIMIIFGGLFDSFHTILFKEVSFIISPYAVMHELTAPLYRLYNINLFIFSLILLVRVHNIFAKIGALYLSMSSVTGLFLLQVPMDPINLSRSFSGASHIFMALLTAVYIIVALLLFGHSFQQNKNLRLLAKVSYIISFMMLVAGFLTGIFAVFSLPVYVGIMEKLPLAAFLVWIVFTAYFILGSDKRVSYLSKKKRKKRS